MISDELKTIYSNEMNLRSYDTLIISHSLFTKTFYFIQDNLSHDLQLADNTPKTFEPLAFSVVLPTLGSSQQDMTIVLDNVNQQLIKEINLAAKSITEPILVTHNVYIDGFPTPQTSDIKLSLRNVKVLKGQVQGTASSKDTIGKAFLTEKYDSRFRGLFVWPKNLKIV